jgi:energy-coupling factor transport system substrate-specific component
VGGQIASLLKLPIYLDSIGTILVAATCGAWPGAITGSISITLNSITSPTNLPYGILNIGFAILAAFLSRRGVFTRLWSSLLSIPLFSIIGGFGGAIVTLVLYGGFSGFGSDFVTAGLVAAGLPVSTAVFVASYPLDMLDKLPQLIIVFIVLNRMSKRLFTKLPLGYVYIEARAKRAQAGRSKRAVAV